VHLQSVVVGIAGGVIVGFELLKAIHMATMKQMVQSMVLQAARCQTIAETQPSRVWLKVGNVCANIAGNWRWHITSASGGR
jgi:hypothetical protein